MENGERFGGDFKHAGGLYFLLMRQAEVKDEEDSHYKIGIALGIEKMNAYWTKLINNSCVYTVATILHPSLNLSWFKYHWRRWPEWINRAQKQFDAFYERESKIHSPASLLSTIVMSLF